MKVDSHNADDFKGFNCFLANNTAGTALSLFPQISGSVGESQLV